VRIVDQLRRRDEDANVERVTSSSSAKNADKARARQRGRRAKRMRFLQGWLGGALLLSLVACAPAPTATAPAAPPAGAGGPSAAPAAATGGSAAPTAAATPVAVQSIQMALSTVSATNTPLWVAADQGLFRRHGLEVELVAMSPASANQALSSGSVPVTVTGGSSVSAWVSGATDTVFVAGLVNKAIFKIVGRPEITRLEELRGRSVGTSTAGSGAALALFEVLRRVNLEPERDVQISYLREQPAILSAVVTGAVDAGVLSPPFHEQAQAQGARLVFDMLDYNIELLANNLTTTRGFLEREPDLVRRLLMGYIEGLQYARDNKADTLASIVKGTRNDDRTEAEAAYTMYRDIWNPWPSEVAIQTILNNSDAPGAKTARPAEMIDDHLLRELERSGWLAAHYRP
jgi:ABC-type nitrate/sulfonate/bicarbonate transport system substrate-binding protein